MQLTISELRNLLQEGSNVFIDVAEAIKDALGEEVGDDNVKTTDVHANFRRFRLRDPDRQVVRNTVYSVLWLTTGERPNVWDDRFGCTFGVGLVTVECHWPDDGYRDYTVTVRNHGNIG